MDTSPNGASRKIQLLFSAPRWFSMLNRILNLLAVKMLRIRGQRPIILHNHLFKNAGSTIDWALKQNFGHGFVDHRDDALMLKGANYLGPYLLENEKIVALSTHHLVMPLPKLANARLMMMVMFRHPIERVPSVYNFERAQTDDTHPGVHHARRLSLRDYIIWRMQPDAGPTIRNFHARRMLPPRKFEQEAISDDEMSDIKRRLSQNELIGSVKLFDESMVLFEEHLRAIFPNIDLSYVAQNVGQQASLTLEAKLRRLQAEIGDETYNLLLNNNQLDLQLSDFVDEEIKSRILKMDAFTEKLSNFRARCLAKAQMSA